MNDIMQMRATAKASVRDRLNGFAPVLLLGVILALNAIITPNFLKMETLWAMLLQSFPVIIMSLGMALVMATGGYDLSVGSSMAAAAVIFAKLAVEENWNATAAFVPALGAALTIGAVNGLIVGVFQLPPLVVTLCTLLVGQGFANFISEGRVITFFTLELIGFARLRLFGYIPVHAVILAAVIAAVFVLVQKTNFGICIQAVGDDPRAARKNGIRAACVLTAVYAANAFLAGTAALFETARLASSDAGTFGARSGFNCIAAVILGGTPPSGGRVRIFGTVIGALIMQAIVTAVNMHNLPHAYALVITAAVLVLTLWNRKGEGL